MQSGRLKYLLNRFSKSKVYLAYDGDMVRLVSSDAVLGLRDGPVHFIHLEKQHRDFGEMYNDEAEFSPQRIQAMAGISYRQLNTWVDRGLFAPIRQRGKTRSFGAYEAFVALVLGKFRAQGASMTCIECLARFLSENAEPERE